jgi:hypothetical protein
MRQPPWNTQEEARAFLREAEALLAAASAPAPK